MASFQFGEGGEIDSERFDYKVNDIELKRGRKKTRTHLSCYIVQDKRISCS